MMKVRLLWTMMAAGLIAGSLAAQDAPKERADSIFAITVRTGPAWDAAKKAHEQPFFKAHSANIAQMKKDGHLVVGGRFSDLGLMLVRVADEAQAHALMARDPSVTAGVFAVSINRWSTFAFGCLKPPTTSP